jgi:hypothetical protein
MNFSPARRRWRNYGSMASPTSTIRTTQVSWARAASSGPRS